MGSSRGFSVAGTCGRCPGRGRIVAVDQRPVDERVSPSSRLVERGGRAVELDGQARADGSPLGGGGAPSPTSTGFGIETGSKATGLICGKSPRDGSGISTYPTWVRRDSPSFTDRGSRQVDLAGLVVDVRFNRGGNVSQILLEKLVRVRVGYQVTTMASAIAGARTTPRPGRWCA